MRTDSADGAAEMRCPVGPAADGIALRGVTGLQRAVLP